MELLFRILLVLHITGGSLGLLTGTVSLIRKKGDRPHRITGKVFAYSMLVAGISSLGLASIHPNYFLFIVGVFTIYLVATGYRYLNLKSIGNNQKPKVIDWAITVGMLVAGVAFIGFGIRLLLGGTNFGIVLITFGTLGLRLVRTDFSNYKGKAITKNYWMLAHLQRMTGAYIAAATAFFVVNAKYSPLELHTILIWLLPTIVLTPFIIAWSRKYKAKAAVPAKEKIKV